MNIRLTVALLSLLAGNPRVHKVIDIGCYELPPAKGLSIIVR